MRVSLLWAVVHFSALVSFSAGISACEKGEQWQWALALLSEMMREAKLEANVISYNAGISACDKCGQWRQALSVLSELSETNLELDEISCNLGLTARGGHLVTRLDSQAFFRSVFRAFGQPETVLYGQ